MTRTQVTIAARRPCPARPTARDIAAFACLPRHRPKAAAPSGSSSATRGNRRRCRWNSHTSRAWRYPKNSTAPTSRATSPGASTFFSTTMGATNESEAQAQAAIRRRRRRPDAGTRASRRDRAARPRHRRRGWPPGAAVSGSRHAGPDAAPGLDFAGRAPQAAEDFRALFPRASLDPLPVPDLARVPSGSRAAQTPLSHSQAEARAKVWAALEALGGMASPAGSCVWHVVGAESSVEGMGATPRLGRTRLARNRRRHPGRGTRHLTGLFRPGIKLRTFCVFLSRQRLAQYACSVGGAIPPALFCSLFCLCASRARHEPEAADFVREHLIDLNATKASERAGYKPAYARRASFVLLRKPEIKAAIAEGMAARAKRFNIDADRVMQEWAKIGFANIGNLAVWGKDGVELREHTEISENDDAAHRAIMADRQEQGPHQAARQSRGVGRARTSSRPQPAAKPARRRRIFQRAGAARPHGLQTANRKTVERTRG